MKSAGRVYINKTNREIKRDKEVWDSKTYLPHKCRGKVCRNYTVCKPGKDQVENDIINLTQNMEVVNE